MVLPKVPDTTKKAKDKVRVIFIMERCRVEGDIHVRPGERVTDFINAAGSQFIPVTNAEVYSLPDGSKSYSVAFLNANKSSINIIFPVYGSEEPL